MYRLIAVFLGLIFASATTAFAADTVDFNRDIRPLISSNCIACHGPDENERAADLRLDTQAGSRSDLGGYAAIVPGDPDESEILHRLTSDDEDVRMPPEGKGRRLNDVEVALIRTWISQGAKYAKHWSYEKPVRPTVPTIADSKLAITCPIDAFVARKLKTEGLAQHAAASQPADRLTLARRVALDLTGLPPTWKEATAFNQDIRADAYERYVDAQLMKPAYGERWARVWLDLARYADSAGYADDRPRTIWAYRDWVIRSLNENISFDQFTIAQLAGDLLDNPTEDQLTATAFHRNTLTNSEGGTNDEEFRNVAVVDRVNTTMEVWMGTTMACAQCHTHKFDPITQAEYFQLFDFFNQSQDADRTDESPTIELFTDPAQKERHEQRLRQIAAMEKALTNDTPEIRSSREKWLNRLQQNLDWQTLEMQSSDGADLVTIAVDEKDKDKVGADWISLNAGDPDTATYRLEFPTKETISALRLEVAPEQNGNFVLSQVTASWTPAKARPLGGRFVRVSLKGKGRTIHLAEVQVFAGAKDDAKDGLENVAKNGTATQSSTGFGGPPQRAIDGNTSGVYSDGSVTHTKLETDPWFEIDLGAEQPIDEIVIWNRQDGLEQRLEDYEISVLDDSREIVWQQQPDDVPTPQTQFSISGTQQLKFVFAVADYEQNGFPASSAILPELDKKKGWAIGGGLGKRHELNLILDRAIESATGTLTVNLHQQSIHTKHTLNRFRLLTSNDPNAAELARLPNDIRSLVTNKNRNAEQDKKIREFYRTVAVQLADQRDSIAKLKEQADSNKPTTSVPVMRDVADDKERVTKIQVRGNYKNQTEVVHRDTPAVFHPLRDDLPKNRLALAHWLVDQENPLTSRVMVNRFWEQIFGIGIVPTNEEFGSQGELPSHPELLDWLATEFQSDWNVKRVLKLMVMSSTYRQSSAVTPELLEADRFNRLYARGPRFRISAEMVRDQALFVSGLLSRKMYGKPVNPPQPNSGLSAAFGSSTDWKTSEGEDKHRRGLYTTWRRSSPYPSMATFDAPDRQVCTSRRSRTNTPLQALVTLNDPVYIEAAQSLARRIHADGGDSIASKVKFALQTCLIREPTNDEVAELAELFQRVSKIYEQRPDDARKLAEEPIGPVPADANPAELAAWTVVSNVILNLDEMFLKR